MSTMITEVYEAFISAGADDEKAKVAAQALADYESRFNRIDSDLRILKWMVGAILAGVVSLIIKSFFT
ncbi:integrase [Candidatus Thiosymbion oneisti]|uniref:integrase n=1 Tax=Candidatus Thiosymbion oneisti TaxID=589554 RepID=UPI000B7D322A|nr:integrase [Candidatus Thiosymbion oneisti]